MPKANGENFRPVYVDGLCIVFDRIVTEPVYNDKKYRFTVWKEDETMLCAFVLDEPPRNRFDIIFGAKKAETDLRERKRRMNPIKMKKVTNA